MPHGQLTSNPQRRVETLSTDLQRPATSPPKWQTKPCDSRTQPVDRKKEDAFGLTRDLLVAILVRLCQIFMIGLLKTIAITICVLAAVPYLLCWILSWLAHSQLSFFLYSRLTRLDLRLAMTLPVWCRK